MSRRGDSSRDRSSQECLDKNSDNEGDFSSISRGHAGILTIDSTPSKIRRGLVALAYMVTSVLLICFNKGALSVYKFNHPNVITLMQLVCSNILLAVTCRANLISFMKSADTGRRRKQRFPTWREIVSVLPLSFAYLIYMLLGMASLEGVNLPMYTTLRRTTAAFTMIAEFILTKRIEPAPVMFCVAVMVLGALVAGMNDLSYDLKGYLLVFASNCTTALYLATISRLGKKVHLNNFGLMWCNGIICAPMLLLMAVISGEINSVLRFQHWGSLTFQIIMSCSCMLAFVLNYTIFLNTSINSALTQTVCGNLKDIAVILIGFQSFGNVAIDPFNLSGIALGVLGSVLYAYVKLTR